MTDATAILEAIQHDLKAAQRKLDELTLALASLPQTDDTVWPRCPKCGPMHGYTERRLADHIHVVHPELEPVSVPGKETP